MNKYTNEKIASSKVLDELSYRIHMRVESYVKEGLYYFSVCPKCGSILERDYQAYCDRCGQSLSWRGK